MKIIIFILSAICFDIQAEINISKVVIKYMEMDIETPIRVECQNYESYFGDYKEFEVKDKIELIKLANIIDTIKYKKTKKENCDVRIKMEIHYSNGKKDIICIGNHIMLFNNKSVCYSSDILKFISEFLKKDSL